MSGQETELDETSTPVAKVKLELTDDKQKKQVLRRMVREHPRGGRAAAVLLLAVVIIGGGLFVRNGLAWESTDDAQVNGHIMPLSARINGYVLEVPVIEGQLVQAGDVLVTIDPKDYKIAVEQAQATFADSQASATSSRFNVPITSVTTKSALDSAETAVGNAEAGFQAAEQAGEGRGLESRLHAQARGQHPGELHVEAGQFARGVLETERRIGAFQAHAQAPGLPDAFQHRCRLALARRRACGCGEADEDGSADGKGHGLAAQGAERPSHEAGRGGPRQ